MSKAEMGTELEAKISKIVKGISIIKCDYRTHLVNKKMFLEIMLK
jgi:hypothetical protein